MTHGFRVFCAALWMAAGVCVAAPAATPPEYKIEKPPTWITQVAADTSAELPQSKQSDGVSYLLIDRQVLIQGSSKQSYSHTAFKIQNESGLESAANIEIRFDPSYQTLLLHSVSIRRGDKTISKLTPTAVKVLQREKSLEKLIFNGAKSANLFLEYVRVGDVVEYAFTLRGSNPVFGGRHFSQFDSQWSVPVQRVYSRLLTESGRNPAITLVNNQPAATLRQLGDQDEYVWDQKDIASLRIREDAPAWFDPYPSAQWSDFRDWKSVVQWGIPLYATPSRLPAELAAEAVRIKSRFVDPADRAAEALRYVQKTVRYLGVEVGPGSHAPTPPDLVLSRRFGDCKDKTLLTLTLLKAVGIEASPALVNTQVKRAIARWQPAPGAFDHVIVRAKVGDTYFWLDPTLPQQMGGLRDISQANFGYALVLAPAQTALTEIPQGPATVHNRKVLAVLDSKAGVQQPVPFTVTTVLEGSSAERLRNTLARVAPEDLQKQLVNYFARYYPSIAIVRPYVISDNIASNQLSITEYYVIPDFWAPGKDKQMAAYAASPDINEYLRAPRDTVRSEPLGLFHPADIRQTTYVLLPESWTYKNGVSKIKDPAFEFESSVSFSPGRLTLVDAIRTLSDSVPAEGMPAYLENLRKARDLLGFSFNRPTKDGD
jgi:transglutaminase-like putative cysteine protease